jgi:hypothetical protein
MARLLQQRPVLKQNREITAQATALQLHQQRLLRGGAAQASVGGHPQKGVLAQSALRFHQRLADPVARVRGHRYRTSVGIRFGEQRGGGLLRRFKGHQQALRER